jgi:hypothetical protein
MIPQPLSIYALELLRFYHSSMTGMEDFPLTEKMPSSYLSSLDFFLSQRKIALILYSQIMCAVEMRVCS